MFCNLFFVISAIDLFPPKSAHPNKKMHTPNSKSIKGVHKYAKLSNLNINISFLQIIFIPRNTESH